MKRLILALLLVAGLAVPATALRPQPASADALCTFFGYIGLCTPFGETPRDCSITQVVARGTAASHSYEYEPVCDDVVLFKVQANYSYTTGRAVEKLSSVRGPAWSIDALWACSDDPWIFSGAAPICGHATVQIKGNPGRVDDYFYGRIPAAFPFSANGLLLTPALRHVLDAQLQNAIRIASTPQAPDVAVIVSDEAARDADCLICDALKPAPPKDPIADLAVVSIAGPTTRQAGLSATYTVTVKNEGDKAAPVELVIVFAGKLDQTGQIVPGPGAGACELRRDAGINAAVRCTGGTLAPGQTTTVVVQGRGQSAGTGMLIATLNPSRAVTESDYANNLKQLNVTVN
jgi:hypothetical protein